MTADQDDDIAGLRDQAEREALRVALAMLANDATPATARASIVRAVLGDAAARRHDPGAGQIDPSAMTFSQLAAAIEQNRRLIARRAGAIDTEFVDVTPPRAGVFD